MNSTVKDILKIDHCGGVKIDQAKGASLAFWEGLEEFAGGSGAEACSARRAVRIRLQRKSLPQTRQERGTASYERGLPDFFCLLSLSR